MQTYIVRVDSVRPEEEWAISGVIEDIESGQKQYSNSLINLQSIQAHTNRKGHL